MYIKVLRYAILLGPKSNSKATSPNEYMSALIGLQLPIFEFEFKAYNHSGAK